MPIPDPEAEALRRAGVAFESTSVPFMASEGDKAGHQQANAGTTHHCLPCFVEWLGCKDTDEGFCWNCGLQGTVGSLTSDKAGLLFRRFGRGTVTFDELDPEADPLA